MVFSGDQNGAIAVLRKAVEVFPENTKLLSTLGLLYLNMGETQKAFEYLGLPIFLCLMCVRVSTPVTVGIICVSNYDYIKCVCAMYNVSVWVSVFMSVCFNKSNKCHNITGNAMTYDPQNVDAIIGWCDI